MVQIGNDLKRGLPMLLLPRFLGLDAAATWTVCTRTFTILNQIVSKPYDYSLPMLCEIYVRGDERKMAMRWTEITQLVLAISVCVFTVGAANNSLFIHLWVGPHLAWSPATNGWVALSCIVAGVATAAFGIVGFHKHLGFIRFVPFLESLLIAVNAWWMIDLWGIVGLIVATMLASLIASIGFGMYHLAIITHTPISELIRDALWRPLRVLPLTAVLAWGCSCLSTLLPGYAGLILSAAMGSVLAGTVTLLLGVSPAVRMEIYQSLQRMLTRNKTKIVALHDEESPAL